jgi:PKD repeat protein
VPIAIADATIGTAPFEVYLDGAESFDPEGGSLEYLWTFGDGSLPGEGTTLSHTFEEPGLYTVSLAVTDDQNAGAIATVEIAVENPDYSGCYAVSDLTISALAIDGAEFFEACDTVTVGPDIEVLSTGYLFLKAGNSVVLNNGFSVVGEGELVIEVDP